MWGNRHEYHPGFFGERESGVPAAIAGIAFVAIAWLVGILGSLATLGNVTGWYAQAEKAPWTPANEVFGPVWLVLYSIMAVAAWLIWRERGSYFRGTALILYVTQLVINAVWTPVFFGGYPLGGSAALWWGVAIILLLDALVLATMIAFARVSLVAAWMLVPYWVWVLYATTLNVFLAVNN
jgi:tryptophan-rich sensory protein